MPLTDDDDRVKNRQRILLSPERFDSVILEQLTEQLRSDPKPLKARPVVPIPAIDRSIDELIDQAYTRSPLTISMLACLQDLTVVNGLP